MPDTCIISAVPDELWQFADGFDGVRGAEGNGLQQRLSDLRSAFATYRAATEATYAVAALSSLPMVEDVLTFLSGQAKFLKQVAFAFNTAGSAVGLDSDDMIHAGVDVLNSLMHPAVQASPAVVDAWFHNAASDSIAFMPTAINDSTLDNVMYGLTGLGGALDGGALGHMDRAIAQSLASSMVNGTPPPGVVVNTLESSLHGLDNMRVGTALTVVGSAYTAYGAISERWSENSDESMTRQVAETTGDAAITVGVDYLAGMAGSAAGGAACAATGVLAPIAPVCAGVGAVGFSFIANMGAEALTDWMFDDEDQPDSVSEIGDEVFAVDDEAVSTTVDQLNEMVDSAAEFEWSSHNFIPTSYEQWVTEYDLASPVAQPGG